MKKRQRLLSDEHWTLVEPLLPPPKRRKDKRGRPPAPNRACFEGILWILQNTFKASSIGRWWPTALVLTTFRRRKQWLHQRPMFVAQQPLSLLHDRSSTN